MAIFNPSLENPTLNTTVFAQHGNQKSTTETNKFSFYNTHSSTTQKQLEGSKNLVSSVHFFYYYENTDH